MNRARLSLIIHFFENLLEGQDPSVSLAVFDGKGRLLSLKACSPAFFAAPSLFLESVREYLSPFKTGDVYFSNDPFSGGVSLHTPMVCLPVFSGSEQQLAYFIVAMKTTELLDKAFATLNLPSNVDAEGVRIPPTRLYENGVANKELLNFLNQQSTTGNGSPTHVLEQLVDICKNLEQKIAKWEDPEGRASVTAGIKEALEVSKSAAERFLGEIPDGDYEFTDSLDSDGRGNLDLKISLKLTFQENKALFDFSGSARQCTGFVNIPYAVTLGVCWASILRLTHGEHPIPAGLFQAINVVAPENSLVNPSYPASIRSGMTLGMARLMDVIMGALHKALPFEIPAAAYGGDTLVRIAFSGKVFQEEVPGGTGSSKESGGKTGLRSYGFIDQHLSIEEIEKLFPIQIVQAHQRHNSGGKGKLNAGQGLTRSYRILEPATVHLIGDRIASRPYGLFGGVPGLPLEISVARPGQKAKPVAEKTVLQLEKGDVITINTPGGGGWGKTP